MRAAVGLLNRVKRPFLLFDMRFFTSFLWSGLPIWYKCIRIRDGGCATTFSHVRESGLVPLSFCMSAYCACEQVGKRFTYRADTEGVEVLTSKEQSILAALEPRANAEGIEVVTIEVVGSRKAPTIRVYLDKPDGIAFDDITAAQVWVNEIMDELDPFPGAYTLEVSSPGIDRPLRTPEHFERFAGEDVYVMTAHPIDGQSRFNAVLAGFDAASGEVLLDAESGRVAVPLDDVKKAHVKGKIEFN